MRFHELFEKRRNPEVNVSPTYEEVISKYASLPNSDEYYVSFTDIPKIGIRPIPQWTDTPIGVYAYPIKYVAEKNGNVRFSSRKYANILQETFPPLGKDSGSPEMVNRAVKIWEKYLVDKFAQNEDLDYIKDYMEYYLTMPIRDSIPKEMYKRAQMMVAIAKMNDPSVVSYTLWNKMLRMAGVKSLVDYGTGYIYDEEPTQAVFLDNTTYKLVERVETKRNKNANS